MNGKKILLVHFAPNVVKLINTLTVGQRLVTSFGAKTMQVRALPVRPVLAGVAQLVELLPSKQNVARSSRVTRSSCFDGMMVGKWKAFGFDSRLDSGFC